MIHFICSTPLQILTSIVLTTSELKKENVILYVVNYFKDAEIYVSRIASLKIFGDVKFLKVKKVYDRVKGADKNTISRGLWQAYYYVGFERVLRKLDISVNKGDKVFLSYLEPICLMLIKHNKKYDLGLHFYGFEDGIGAYVLPLDRQEGKGEHIFCPEPYYKKEMYWVYRPEFIIEPNSYKRRVHKISFNLDKTLVSYFDKIWDIGNTIDNLPKTIFFDDLISKKTLKLIMDTIAEAGLEDIYVKLHPRQTDSSVYEKYNYKFLQPQAIPFECFLLKHEIGDNVLISIFSSAVVNSVYMFDQRPLIIFLYKVIDDSEYNTQVDFDLQVNNLRKIYSDEKKIYVPGSMEEFYLILKRIANGEIEEQY